MYELGDASMKEQLVHALVNTLTGSAKKKKAIKVHNVFLKNFSFFMSSSVFFSPQGVHVLIYLH